MICALVMRFCPDIGHQRFQHVTTQIFRQLRMIEILKLLLLIFTEKTIWRPVIRRDFNGYVPFINLCYTYLYATG